MKRLMRMAYGRSGSRMERVLVSAPLVESANGPRWLTMLSMALLVAVPLFICRYAPRPPAERRTIVDTSRLAVKQVPVPQTTAVQKPQPPVEQCPLPAAKPAVVEQTVEEPPERQSAQPPREEIRRRPVIARPSAQAVPAVEGRQPRIARERLQVPVEPPSQAQARVRRDSPVSEVLTEAASITRTRQAIAADLPAAKGVTASLRRSSAPAEAPPVAGGTRIVRRGVASSGGADAGASASRVPVVRERSVVAEGTGGGKATSIGLSRGVPLSALGICSSSQQEDDAIRSVLRVVGARRSCRNEKGEYLFTGTIRVSSFNLTIFPVEGRKPSNRCEELENAYACLQTR